ncbi:MAG: LacI family transcriptional regulator [Ruminococcaceae bacterium]|nr:LacI family transcriptional regulator [Oscillospiraceae bacterium]
MEPVTIYTLAKELNMTPSMVSRAFHPQGKINPEKRELVLETAKKYGFSPNQMASRLSRKRVCIGILINSRFTVNTENMMTGIQKAYEQLKDYKVEYQVMTVNPLETASEEYDRLFEQLAEYDGVIVAGFSSEEYTERLNRFYEKNQRLVQVQAVNETANYLFGSKHDERVASQTAAEFLYQALRYKNRKNILLFTGNRDSTLHFCAEKEFMSACDQKGLTVIQSVDMKDQAEYLEQLLPELFQQYGKKIDGIYMTSGLSEPLCRYLDQQNLRLPFVAFDLYSEMIPYLENDVISATIFQNVADQMQCAFTMLGKHLLQGEKCPRQIYTNVHLVLKSNYKQYI